METRKFKLERTSVWYFEKIPTVRRNTEIKDYMTPLELHPRFLGQTTWN